MLQGKSSLIGMVVVGILLSGCSGGGTQQAEQPDQRDQANSSPEKSSSSGQPSSASLSENQRRMAEAEADNRDYFWEETCPGQVADTGDGQVLFQGAMELPADEEVRLWNYSRIAEVGQPVRFIEPGEAVCITLAHNSEKFKYQGNYRQLYEVKDQNLPQGEAYIDLEPFPYYLNGDNSDYMSKWKLREDLTPLDEAKKSPVHYFETCSTYYDTRSCGEPVTM